MVWNWGSQTKNLIHYQIYDMILLVIKVGGFFMFSPVKMCIIMWVAILSLYSIKLLDYGGLSGSFYLAVSLNLLFVLLGGIFARLCMPKSWNMKDSKENAQNFINDMRAKEKGLLRIYKVLLFLGFVGILLIYTKVLSQISFGSFISQQATVKSLISRSVLGNYLASSAYVAIPVSVILVLINKKRKMLIVYPLIQCIVYSVSFWGRVPVMVALIMLVSSYLITKQSCNIAYGRSNKIKVMKLLVSSTLAFIFVISILSWTIELRMAEFGVGYTPYTYYLNYSSNLNLFLAENLPDEGITYRGVVSTYSYLTASIPTLDFWVSRDSEFAMGQASFPYIARLFQQIGLIQGGELITGDRPLGNGLQLPTLIGYAYIDYGYIGVILSGAFIGFIGNFLYLKNLRKPKLKFIFYLSNVYVLVLLAPLISATAWTSFVIIIFGFVLVVAYIDKPVSKYRITWGDGSHLRQ